MADFPHSFKSIPKLVEKMYGDNYKVWSYPTNKQHYLYDNKDQFKNYEEWVVDIDDLIRDNDLDNPVALSNHPEIWSPTQSEEDIHPDKFQYKPELDNKPGDLIFGTLRSDGRIILSDGRHRVRALKNGGYTHVKIPILNEEIPEDWGLRESYYNTNDPRILNGIAKALPYFYNHDPKLTKRIQQHFRAKAKRNRK